MRIEADDRPGLLEDAPETYYVTSRYDRHPVVLARMASLDPAALDDLLRMSWRLTMAPSPRRRQPGRTREPRRVR